MRNSSRNTGDWREWRRQQAYHLSQLGWLGCEIAEALDVTPESVSRWLSRVRRDGVEALQTRKPPGRPPKLTSDQQALIPELLWHDPEAYGFQGCVWTCSRIAKVIEQEFGVHYHKAQVARVMQRLGWSPQLPIRRAIQRDEASIEFWRRNWPNLRRASQEKRRSLIFEDESGFYLFPGRGRSYAPIGHPAVIRGKLSRDHLSVMGAMTPQGEVFTGVRHHALTGLDCIEFLDHLQCVLNSRLLVVWDGSPIHRRREVREFVAKSRDSVRIEQLPGYAPDLNPWDEGGWNYIKNVLLKNVVCRDLEELHEKFHEAISRLRKKPRMIQSFYQQAGLRIRKSS